MELSPLVRNPKISFLDLSRELRDLIYFHCLYTVFPITISESPQNPSTEPLSPFLAFGLFYANRTVSHEALEYFYGFNPFRVGGNDKEPWSLLWTFLKRIGSKNRSCIRTLIIFFPYCQHAFVDPDGTLYQVCPVEDEEGRSHYRVCAPEVGRTPLDFKVVSPYGFPKSCNVEILEPAARACFRAIGSTGSRMKFVMKPRWRELPGVGLYDNSEMNHPKNRGRKALRLLPRESVYIPEALETIAKDETDERVAVIWMIHCPYDAFVDRKRQMEQVGWEILNATGFKHLDKYATDDSHMKDIFIIFEVRWRGKDITAG